MSKIFVVKRRAGIEHVIPVWNLGGFIETPVSHNIDAKTANMLEAALSLDTV